jgi:ketosteroid isomerase-like protein
MKRTIQLLSLGLIAVIAIFARATHAADQDARKSLDAFNQQFITACQKMDNPAAAALWSDDGADLLPGMQPMVGKAKISEWLSGLTPQLGGAKMLYCTVDWKDVQIHGDIAYEWGINRQKIEFPAPRGGFENEGKILLILKRQGDGSWRIALESWNANPQPEKKS